MPEKFLVIRLSSIGDIVHALPAVSALAEAHPQAEIHWLIEHRYSVLLEENPFVHRVVCLDTLGWRTRLLSRRTLGEAARSLLALRRDRYDAVIDFQGLLKTALIARLCRSSRRIGYAKWRHREPGAGLFYTEEVPLRGAGHVVEESLALVGTLGAHPTVLRFPLPQRAEDERYIDAGLAEIGAREFILVSPGGGWVAKRWAPENYAALIARLPDSLRAYGLPVVLTGTPSEERDIEIVLRGAESAHYVPTTLGQYIALARRARLFIGGDTGPMHLASALGVPVVALMGPTDASRNGPFCSSDIALSNRGPINHTRRAKAQKFMDGISVEDVLAAVEERLARAHAP